MKLLTISTIFPNKTGQYTQGAFIKEHLKVLNNFFDEIYVIVPIPKTFGLLSSDKYCKDYIMDIENGTIKIFYPRYVYLPVSLFRNNLDRIWEKIISKTIEKYNICFDYIYANFTWQSGAAVNLISRKYKRDYFLHVHEDHEWFLEEYKSKNYKYISAWKNAKFTIRPTISDISLLEQYNSHVYHIPYPVDTNIFRPLDKDMCRKKIGFDVDGKLILNIGNYVPQKNQELIIKAADILINKNENDDLYFYIVGGGKLKKHLHNLIKKYNLEKHVFLKSYIPHEQLVYLYNTADVFVLPSISESFGVVSIEALSCGIPVITTINGGTEHIVKYSYLGKVIQNKNNATKLANAIIEKIHEKKNHEIIREYIIENYSVDAVRNKWSQVLSKLVDL